MPKTLKKMVRHIAFEVCVRAFVRLWIPHKKIAGPYFSTPRYLPLWSYGPLN